MCQYHNFIIKLINKVIIKLNKYKNCKFYDFDDNYIDIPPSTDNKDDLIFILLRLSCELENQIQVLQNITPPLEQAVLESNIRSFIYKQFTGTPSDINILRYCTCTDDVNEIVLCDLCD